MTTQPHETKSADHPQTGPDVTVTIDNVLKTIHRGSHLVSELKALLGVSSDLALAEVIDGQITPLKDDDRVTIKGGEAFFKGPRTGGSS
jgi:hypothetical protein